MLARTAGGADILINRLSPNAPAAPKQTTEWMDYRGQIGEPIDSHFGLSGLFKQRRKELARANGEAFIITAFIAPERFNTVMQLLGRTPGEDCFKLVDIKAGEFSPRTQVEAVSRLEVPVSITNDYYVGHDRDLADHIPVWWSTSRRKALVLQERAIEVLGSDDESQIAEFSHGVDMLTYMPSMLIKSVAEAVHGEWQEESTLEKRFEIVTSRIDELCKPVWEGATLNWHHKVMTGESGLKPLIKLGFIEGISLSSPDSG